MTMMTMIIYIASFDRRASFVMFRTGEHVEVVFGTSKGFVQNVPVISKDS